MLLLGLILSAIAAAGPVPGDKVAPFELQRADGAPFTWSPGKVTLFTFCAFWCNTWKTQLVRVTEANRKLQGLPIDYLAASVDGRWTELAKTKLTLLKDSGGVWSNSVGIDRVPFTFVVDVEGKVRWVRGGICRSEDLCTALRDALAVEPSSGVVYLTFDDFPKGDGDALLDLLAKEEVPATFFCIGSKLAASADLLKRAVREGHQLQIHSWSHDGDNPRLKNCVAALESVGAHPTLYRPPGRETFSALGGPPVKVPVVDPYDYRRPGTKEILRRVLLAVRPGSAIQLHAGVEQTVQVLPELVRSVRAMGLQFQVLK